MLERRADEVDVAGPQLPMVDVLPPEAFGVLLRENAGPDGRPVVPDV